MADGLRVAADIGGTFTDIAFIRGDGVVATRKDDRLVSSKLLIARPVDPHGKPEGSYLVAVDTVDAGFSETVLIVSGSSARMASGLKDCPVDAAIVGIVDTIQVRENEG